MLFRGGVEVSEEYALSITVEVLATADAERLVVPGGARADHSLPPTRNR